MPNRILKESIKRSPEIDKLKPFEENVFYRIIITANDYGRLDGRAVVLKSDLYPTKEDVTKKSISDAITQLACVGLVRRYEVNGNPYLYLPTWELHQRVRNKKSKYPEPPSDHMRQAAANCSQLTADCGELRQCDGLNPIRIQIRIGIQSETGTHESAAFAGSERARARVRPPATRTTLSWTARSAISLPTARRAKRL